MDQNNTPTSNSSTPIIPLSEELNGIKNYNPIYGNDSDRLADTFAKVLQKLGITKGREFSSNPFFNMGNSINLSTAELNSKKAYSPSTVSFSEHSNQYSELFNIFLSSTGIGRAMGLSDPLLQKMGNNAIAYELNKQNKDVTSEDIHKIIQAFHKENSNIKENDITRYTLYSSRMGELNILEATQPNGDKVKDFDNASKLHIKELDNLVQDYKKYAGLTGEVDKILNDIRGSTGSLQGGKDLLDFIKTNKLDIESAQALIKDSAILTNTFIKSNIDPEIAGKESLNILKNVMQNSKENIDPNIANTIGAYNAGNFTQAYNNIYNTNKDKIAKLSVLNDLNIPSTLKDVDKIWNSLDNERKNNLLHFKMQEGNLTRFLNSSQKSELSQLVSGEKNTLFNASLNKFLEERNISDESKNKILDIIHSGKASDLLQVKELSEFGKDSTTLKTLEAFTLQQNKWKNEDSLLERTTKENGNENLLNLPNSSEIEELKKSQDKKSSSDLQPLDDISKNSEITVVLKSAEGGAILGKAIIEILKAAGANL